MRHIQSIRLCVSVAMLAAVAVFPIQASDPTPAPRPAVLHGLAPPVEGAVEKLVITISDSRGHGIDEVLDALREAGGRRMRAFDPDLVIGEFPLGADFSAVHSFVSLRIQKPGDVRPDQKSKSGASPWHLVRKPPPPDPSQTALMADLDLSEVCGVRESPPDPAAAPDEMGLVTAEEPRYYNQNALLMSGRILVNIVLPEAQSPRWTDSQIADVLEQCNRAFDTFDRDGRYSQLEIVFRTHLRIRLVYDPMWYSPEVDRYWISSCINGIGGTTGGSSIEMTHRYNEQKRQAYRADWALMILVANSTNTQDYLFRESREISWSVLGGPYMVLPYPAGGLIFTGFQSLLRHEIGHIFWALDETNGGRHVCADTSGYLRYPNLNRNVGIYPGVACDSFAVACPMNMDYGLTGYTGPICTWTQGMIGVVDRNENDVPDALDAPPTVSFVGAEVETLFTPLSSIRVNAEAQSLPNRNPRILSRYRLRVVAPLKDVLVSVTYFHPIVYTPEDVGSDGATMQVDVPIPSMFPGWNDVDAVARNIFLSTSRTLRKRYLFVDLDFTTFELTHPSHQGVTIRWIVRGETFGAYMEVFRRNTRSGEMVCIAEGVQPAGPPDVGHTPYELTDVALEPGVQYEYFIRGTIDIVYRGETVTIVRESPMISTQAAVPREASVSNVAPNPFNPDLGRTWLSVTLPQGSQTLVQTPVELSVFDVAGRRVNTIANGKFLGDVHTFSWDGTDDRGLPVPSGIYFFRLVAAEEITSRKVLVIRP